MTVLLKIVEDSAFATLPVNKSEKSKIKNKKPGWSENVKPVRETAFFWSQVWKSAGRPINT